MILNRAFIQQGWVDSGATPKTLFLEPVKNTIISIYERHKRTDENIYFKIKIHSIKNNFELWLYVL